MDGRDRWASLAGVGLLGTFVGVLLEHGVAQGIGGVSLYGVHDAAPVLAFYGHAALGPLYWVCAGMVLFLGAFAVGVRGYLRSFGAVISGELAFLFVAVEIPLLLAHYGIDIAMVDLAPGGSSDVLISLLGVWNGLYHWVIEWTEVGWMACLAWAGWKMAAIPRWSSGWAALVAAGLGFNMVARLVRLPERTMMPTYALFSFWMLATAIALFSEARKAKAALAGSRGAMPSPAASG